jgi:hypothetical protein
MGTAESRGGGFGLGTWPNEPPTRPAHVPPCAAPIRDFSRPVLQKLCGAPRTWRDKPTRSSARLAGAARRRTRPRLRRWLRDLPGLGVRRAKLVAVVCTRAGPCPGLRGPCPHPRACLAKLMKRLEVLLGGADVIEKAHAGARGNSKNGPESPSQPGSKGCGWAWASSIVMFYYCKPFIANRRITLPSRLINCSGRPRIEALSPKRGSFKNIEGQKRPKRAKNRLKRHIITRIIFQTRTSDFRFLPAGAKSM